MARNLPRRTGSDSSTLENARPLLIGSTHGGFCQRLSEIFESAAFPAAAIFSQAALRTFSASLSPQLVILDLDNSWAINAGIELRQRDIPLVAMSDDEVAQLRALRYGFLEALPMSISDEALVARIRNLIRLPNEVKPTAEGFKGSLSIDPRERQAFWEGNQLDLARGPYDLLSYLAERAGVIISKAQLKRDFHWIEDNTLHQSIWELRNALGPAAAAHIVTRSRYGYGYLPVITDKRIRPANASASLPAS